MAPTLPKGNEMIKKIIPDFVEIDKLNEQLLLQWVHENHGHIGYNKMLHLTRNYVEEGEIQNLSGKIVKILKSCLPCQMKHKAYSREVTETPVVATAPGQLLAMDILGPMNETERKNKYVLLTMDVFSRIVTLIELENYKLDEVSTKLWQRVFLQYGYYHTVRCDNSGNFKNQQLEDWLANMNIQLDHSSEYHHSGNSLAKKYIGAAQQVIFKLCHNNPTQWDMCLKLAEFTLNTSTCSKTGYSAFFLMFAREPVLPLTLLTTCSKTGYSAFFLMFAREPVLPLTLLTNKSPYAMIENTPTMAQLTAQLKEIFEDMHELRIDEELNGKTTKAGYIELKVGDAILIMVHRKPGISTKLQPTYDSKIYHVVSISIDYVRIKGEGDRKSMVLHRTLIKKISHSTPNKGGSSENGENPTDIGKGNK
uniref:Integrase catalytic domain-containing protein n=1 Tax=Strongyloides papillosus TaxID=174720 RepID=A0A0N5BSI5_STREA